jgi:hypothetical protein
MSIPAYISKLFLICLVVIAFGRIAFCQQSNTFRHNLQGDQLPWTKSPVISGESYRFLVLGDLTGGQVPGIFDLAIDRINDLAPDFVITVGDIVEGYTNSREEATTQWNDFGKSISRLEMPFFVTAGNHDITNEMLVEEWQKRWGYLHYSFYAGKALFIVMNYYETNGFSNDQVDYVLSALNSHQQGDPVFLFIHDGFWKLKNRNGFATLQEAFNKHNITFFCGHEHRYQHRNINGQNHYMLAGLASGNIRGYNIGEYYNLMQISVNTNRVRIANIDLEGLIPTNVVSDNNIKQVDVLRSRRWVSISPTNMPTNSASEISTQIHFSNPGDYPLQINVTWPMMEHLQIEPAEFSVILQPGESHYLPVKLLSETPVIISQLPVLNPILTAHYHQPGQELTGDAQPIWVIDNIRKSQPETIGLPWGNWEKPGYVEESWDWSGFDDAAFAMKITHDKENIYIRVKVTDDKFLLRNETNTNADELRVYFTPETESEPAQPIIFEYIAGTENITITGSEHPSFIKTSVEQNNSELTTTITFPRRFLPGNRFRLNIAWSDKDNPFAMDNAVLWWKPRWNSSNDYHQSGVFLID